jgi:hypothetical protein
MLCPRARAPRALGNVLNLREMKPLVIKIRQNAGILWVQNTAKHLAPNANTTRKEAVDSLSGTPEIAITVSNPFFTTSANSKHPKI